MAIFIFNGAAPQDPNMYYAGHVLPRDAVKPVQPSIDYTNNPDLITLGVGQNTISLPGNVVVYISGEKILAEAQILDGVEITQHIARRAQHVIFEFDLWQTDNNGKDIFPQDLINDLYTFVINPDSVINVTNTLLNGAGISELIVKKHNLDTVRGSTKSPGRIECKENIPGNYLIVS